MTKEEIQDKIESIEDKLSEEFLGSNEVHLHFKEEIVDWIHSLITENKELRISVVGYVALVNRLNKRIKKFEEALEESKSYLESFKEQWMEGEGILNWKIEQALKSEG